MPRANAATAMSHGYSRLLRRLLESARCGRSSVPERHGGIGMNISRSWLLVAVLQRPLRKSCGGLSGCLDAGIDGRGC